MQQPDLRVLIAFPVQQQVVRAHVVLLADAREGADADTEPAQAAEQREAHPSGLDGDAHTARSRGVFRK